MTIITHDDGTCERVHLAYEGPYPWDDGADVKAKVGVEGWKIFQTPRPEAGEDMLIGALVSDWDFASGKFLGTRPKPPEPTEVEKLKSEEADLLAYLSRTDWYVIRFADDGTEIPAEVKAARASARARISKIRIELKYLEDTHVD